MSQINLSRERIDVMFEALDQLEPKYRGKKEHTEKWWEIKDTIKMLVELRET